MTYMIETRNITKWFGQTLANDRINLSVKKGHIHAVLGENGAGKSTLMKMLYGEEQPNEGEIFINGESKKLIPATAIKLGIGLIHQHFMLIREYTIPENYSLGNEPTKFKLFTDYKPVEKEAAGVLERLGLPLDMSVPVGHFSVEEQQIIEIGKALYRGAEILILDEPTSVLTPQKIEKLLELLRSLRNEGKTIILITHKIQEALAVADEITVLRKGKLVATLPRSEADKDKLVELMMGSKPLKKVARETTSGEAYARISNLSVKNQRGQKTVKDVSFNIARGEVYGITGVGGNGQAELVEALIGLSPVEDGEIWLGESLITNYGLGKRRLSGISYVPEDRIHRGSCVDLSVLDNIIMGHHRRENLSNGLFINYGKSRQVSEGLVKEYDIVLDTIDAKAGSLSGGNLQKVVIAREFSFDADFMIIAYPSQGIDIRTTNFVHSEIIRRRNEGIAILLITGDLDEVFALSDRVGVMYGGELVFETRTEDTDRFELGQYMTGARSKEL